MAAKPVKRKLNMELEFKRPFTARINWLTHALDNGELSVEQAVKEITELTYASQLNTEDKPKIDALIKKLTKFVKDEVNPELGGKSAKKGGRKPKSAHKKGYKGGKKSHKKGHKGARSKTRRGRLDFITHKGSKVFNRRSHYQKKTAKGVKKSPY